MDLLLILIIRTKEISVMETHYYSVLESTFQRCHWIPEPFSINLAKRKDLHIITCSLSKIKCYIHDYIDHRAIKVQLTLFLAYNGVRHTHIASILHLKHKLQRVWQNQTGVILAWCVKTMKTFYCLTFFIF